MLTFELLNTGKVLPGIIPAVIIPDLTVIFAEGISLKPHLTTLALVHLSPPTVKGLGLHRFVGLDPIVPPPANGLTKQFVLAVVALNDN